MYSHILVPTDGSALSVFEKNDDPRFGSEPDHAFRKMFSRIVRLASPELAMTGKKAG